MVSCKTALFRIKAHAPLSGEVRYHSFTQVIVHFGYFKSAIHLECLLVVFLLLQTIPDLNNKRLALIRDISKGQEQLEEVENTMLSVLQKQKCEFYTSINGDDPAKLPSVLY